MSRALPVKGTGAPLPRYLPSGACTDGRVRSVARDRFDVNEQRRHQRLEPRWLQAGAIQQTIYMREQSDGGTSSGG